MIGVISSTIFPSADPLYWGGPRTCIPSQERLEQTRQTIASLANAGVTRILLADNSGQNWQSGTEELLQPAEVHVFNQHQFQNKGISELYTLLGIVKFIPPDTPILKISGRYYLTAEFDHQIGGDDLVVRETRHDGVNQWMSTRCYLARNAVVFENFLRAVLRDLYGYGSRIVGPRSFLRILRHSISPHQQDYPYDDPVSSIEVPAARVLRGKQFRVRWVDKLGIEGISGDYGETLISQ